MTSTLDGLRGRLRDRTAVVGVIGLGYVGLPQALAFAEAGYRVLGFDIDPAKPQALAAGRSYLSDIPSDRVAALVSAERLAATSEFDRVRRVRRPHRVRADTTLRARRAGPLGRVRHSLDPRTPSPTGAARGAREHDVPGYHGGAGPSSPRSARPCGRSGCRPRILARAGGSRESTLRAREHAQASLGLHGDVQGPHRAPLRTGGGQGGAGIQHARCRGVEASREHLPGREHRAGQRAQGVLRRGWGSTCGRSSGRPRRSRSDSRPSTPDRASVATASPSTPSTSRGRHASTISTRASSSWLVRSTPPCPNTSWVGCGDALDLRGTTLRGARILVLGVAYKRDTGDIRESPALRILSDSWRAVARASPTTIPTCRRSGARATTSSTSSRRR